MSAAGAPKTAQLQSASGGSAAAPAASVGVDTTSHPGPLAGLRVLELAQIMAGPTCGALLADLGADVIKVEKIQGGDDARGYREPRVNGVSAPFLILNRGKRGIAIDLKRREGRDVLLRMVRTADVLIENFRRDTMDKLGLSYEVLAVEHPALIYCAITGFGRDGPYADKGGFDLVAQGFAGLMSITGEPDRPPVKTGNPVSDINAFMVRWFLRPRPPFPRDNGPLLRGGRKVHSLLSSNRSSASRVRPPRH